MTVMCEIIDFRSVLIVKATAICSIDHALVDSSLWENTAFASFTHKIKSNIFDNTNKSKIKKQMKMKNNQQYVCVAVEITLL